MAIYELEERIFFDGALPADIMDIQDETSTQKQNAEIIKNTSNESTDSENVSIAPDTQINNETTDNQGNTIKSNDIELTSFSSSTGPSEIEIALSGIEDIELPEGYEPDVNVILVSADNKNYKAIKDSVNNEIIVVEYNSDDSLETILQNLKEELGDRQAVNIGVIGGQLLDKFSELQTVDGDISFIEIENDRQSYTSYNTDYEGIDRFSEYFNTDTDYFNNLHNSNDLPADLSIEASAEAEALAKKEVIFINPSVMNTEEIVNGLSFRKMPK